MERVNIQKLKENFPAILKKVQTGIRIVVCYHNKPVAELTPLPSIKKTKRKFDTKKDTFRFNVEEFQSSDELIDSFEESPLFK